MIRNVSPVAPGSESRSAPHAWQCPWTNLNPRTLRNDRKTQNSQKHSKFMSSDLPILFQYKYIQKTKTLQSSQLFWIVMILTLLSNGTRSWVHKRVDEGFHVACKFSAPKPKGDRPKLFGVSSWDFGLPGLKVGMFRFFTCLIIYAAGLQPPPCDGHGQPCGCGKGVAVVLCLLCIAVLQGFG